VPTTSTRSEPRCKPKASISMSRPTIGRRTDSPRLGGFLWPLGVNWRPCPRKPGCPLP
jgi:hypothetical protein